MDSLKEGLKSRLQGSTFLRLYYDLYPQKPLYIPTLFRYLRLSRWVIYLEMRLRMLFFVMRNAGAVRELKPGTDSAGARHLTEVVRHNLMREYFSSRFSRRRSEHLIYLVRAVEAVAPDARVLSIGPKNEGEPLLWRAHGFKHVEAIDLFSYTPWIQLMDMHHMGFPDSRFDVISSGYVVRYSYDIGQCAREMIRVAKNGGVIAIAFSASPAEPDGPEVGAPLRGGIDELLGYFQPHVKHVYWRMEDDNRDETRVPAHTHSLVFSVKK
jgi:SAM-dependent methyltransferase